MVCAVLTGFGFDVSRVWNRFLSDTYFVGNLFCLFLLATFRAHADGERRKGRDRTGGWRRKRLGDARLWAPSDRRGSSAFAGGILVMAY